MTPSYHKAEIEKIVLTEEEKEAALLEAKRRKYNKERFRTHWEEQEKKKAK